MKRFLLLVLLFFYLGFNSKLSAQCEVGPPTVANVTTWASGDSCFAKFDLSFAMKNNNGNKTIGIDLWQSLYYTRPTYDKAPLPSELSNALGSIVLDNNNTSTSLVTIPFFSSYPWGASARILRVSAISRTFKSTVDSFYFNLSDVIVAVKKASDGTCPVSMLTIKGDVWASNAPINTTPKVHCVSSLGFSLGNPSIPSASRNCSSPRTLNFRIETTSTASIAVTYDIFKDDGYLLNNEAVFNPTLDLPVTMGGTQTVTGLSATNPYIAQNVAFIGNENSEASTMYWIIVYYSTLGQTFSVSRLIDNQCTVLPVSFKSFSATRNKANVAIRWETAMEQDNKGFYVQRNVEGEWKNIAFVFSAATNGNSSEVLSYVYNDANNFKTVSQYRILQVDIDGKGKYTEIRSVRAEEQVAKVMVFPNPSSDKVNVLFEDGNSAKDVVVTDISGRVVKQYRSITSNNLVIENLTDGFYTIQITDQQTAVSTVEKVVVKKR